MSEVMKCPVCGKEKKKMALSGFDCEYCGFNNAFVKYFVSEKSYKVWQESVRNAVQNITTKKRILLSDSRCLRVGNGTIAFLDLEKSKIYIALNNGKVQVENDAVEFDSSERNYAIVYKNETVKVFGNDNEFGQKNTESWTNIQHVLTAPNCTYGVRKNGTIMYAGSPADSSVLKWSNIRFLRSYEDTVIGIRSEGSVVLPEKALFDTELTKAKKWQHIKDVVVFRGGAAGLTKSGKVLFLGKNDDPKRECMTWNDIIAIEADNTYIYGLSKKGELFVAGNCKSFLDKGRKNASAWKNIMMISCNKAGIGALNEEGVFSFAGTFAGDKAKIIDAFNNISVSV